LGTRRALARKAQARKAQARKAQARKTQEGVVRLVVNVIVHRI
jgi:hypothetical protein